MNYLYYISVYLIIGAVVMLILDVMHNMVKDQVDEEFKEGYTNLERAYIIFAWPTFLYNLIRHIIKDKQS